MTGHRASWLQAFAPAHVTGPRPAFAAGLIAVLALAQPAGSFAQQAGNSIVVDTLSATPNVEPPGPATTPTGGAAPLRADRPPAAGNDPDILPFAHNEVPESFPSFGFAFGAGGFVPGFATVDQAFRAIEDVHRAEGFSVPSAADVRLGPILLPTLKVRLNRWLDVAFQMGRTLNSKGREPQGSIDQLTLMGGLVSGRLALSPAGRVSLFAGLGGGTYRFSFRRNYGVRVSPNDGNGGYYELEAITLQGGGGYWTTAGGLTIRAFPRGALEALAQYVGTGDVSTQAGDVRVNMSGTMIAVSITSFF